MSVVADLVIAGLILGLTYALTSEGLWGAALMFFNVLFAGMIAFNFYEPVAALIDRTGINWGFSDTLSIARHADVRVETGCSRTVKTNGCLQSRQGQRRIGRHVRRYLG